MYLFRWYHTGIINLKSCTEVKEREPIKGHKFAFDICTFERVYHLACETEEERKDWINTLNTLLFEEPRKQVQYNLLYLASFQCNLYIPLFWYLFCLGAQYVQQAL